MSFYTLFYFEIYLFIEYNFGSLFNSRMLGLIWINIGISELLQSLKSLEFKMINTNYKNRFHCFFSFINIHFSMN